MTKTMGKYWNWGLSVLVGIGVFLFWYVWYPHALSYQEQYQLFLWTGDYFVEKISLPGGFADWAGEFIVLRPVLLSGEVRYETLMKVLVVGARLHSGASRAKPTVLVV